MKMDLESYKESLKGGLFNEEEVEEIIEEMRTARPGTIKPQWWWKRADDEYEIFDM